MSRFVVANDAYDSIRLREDEFEDLVARKFSRLAQDWHWLPWKPLLDGPEGRSRPDALVYSHRTSRWWVVEVELARHDESHFEDQFNRISTAKFDVRYLDATFDAFAPSQRDRLREVVAAGPPDFLCVADQPSLAIARMCRTYGFELLAAAPYRSPLGNHGLLVEQVPRSLLVEGSQARYLLKIADGTFGGRQTAHLPSNFPVIEEILIASGAELTTVRIKSVQGQRFVLLPSEFYVRRGEYGALRAIDPENHRYELEKGSVRD